jgi:hypothetical protein
MSAYEQKTARAILAEFLESQLQPGSALLDFLAQYHPTQVQSSITHATIEQEIQRLRIEADVTMRVTIRPERAMDDHRNQS